jgi:hypothetical protein
MRKEFGIYHGGNIETPILKFLYSMREYDECYSAALIATAIKCDVESVRGALSRLRERKYVKSFYSSRDRRQYVWRIRRDAKVYRIVERRIGILRNYESEDSEEDYTTTVSHVAERLSPLKEAIKVMFPAAAIPVEVGYQILSNLDTVRNIYNLANADSINSNDLRIVLNDAVSNATRMAISQLGEFAVRPIKEKVIPNFVENSCKYLDGKGVFKDVTTSLGLDESYSEQLKDFYNKSLNNCLHSAISWN